MKRFITLMLASLCLISTAEAAKLPSGYYPKRELRKSYRALLKTGDYYIESHTVVRIIRRNENTPKGLKSRKVITYVSQLPQDKPDSTSNITTGEKNVNYVNL